MNQFISYLLSFILLNANLGVSLGSHYCHDQRVNTEINVGQLLPETCGMETSHNNNKESFISSGCCKNSISSIQTDKSYSASHQDLGVHLELHLVFVACLFNFYCPASPEQTTHPINDLLSPTDRQVELQTFIL